MANKKKLFELKPFWHGVSQVYGFGWKELG